MKRVAGAACAWVVGFAVSCGTWSSAALAQQRTGQMVGLDTEDESSSLPWRGSLFTFSQSLNVDAFSRSAQLSYDPTYAWTFIFEPRWYLTKKTYLNIDQRLALELTDSDTTLTRQRAMLSDTIVGVDTELWADELQRVGRFALRGGAHLIAPSSIASRAATMVVGARARAGADMTWNHVLKGAVLAVQGRYGHRFLRHNTLGASQGFPCIASGLASANCGFLDSLSNVEDQLAAIVSGSLNMTDTLTLELLAWVSWSRGANLVPTSITTDTGFVVDLPDDSVTHWRNDRYLVLGVDWAATDWLSLALSVVDYFPERNPDGTLRSIANPLDLLVGLSASFAFDKLYLNATGRTPSPETASR